MNRVLFGKKKSCVKICIYNVLSVDSTFRKVYIYIYCSFMHACIVVWKVIDAIKTITPV